MAKPDLVDPVIVGFNHYKAHYTAGFQPVPRAHVWFYFPIRQWNIR